jgi:hypothetical protein
MVSTEEENGYDAIEIEEDVYDDERQAVNAIKVGITAEATHVQQSLSARATEIEKAILEERLSAKLGKRVKLVIEEDEVRPMEGDDELFHGLHALAPPTTPSSTSTKPKGATDTTTPSSSSVYGKSSTSATHPVSTTTSTYNKNGKNSTSATHPVSTTTSTYKKNGWNASTIPPTLANPIRTGNTTTNTTTSVKPNSDGTSARGVNTGTQSATTSTINTTTTMTTTSSKDKKNKKSSDVKSKQNKQGSKTKNNPSKF